MLYHISKLHRDEQELVKKAPLLVCILVAGADGNVDSEEIKKSVNLIHTKSFSETSDIRHLYKEIDHDVEASLNSLLKELPTDSLEREKRISEQLAGLNSILAKLDPQIARDFYKSLRNFALRVALISGGIFGMGQISYEEKEVVKLPMVNEPGN
ncbi:MAG: hypothetical protein ACKVQB_12550 [Bacteroidia bacterium]